MKIKSSGLSCLLFLAGVFPAACTTPPFSRTIYVPPGTPVRLRETVRNVKVWVKTKTGKVPVVMDLQEGWYVLSDPGEGK